MIDMSDDYMTKPMCDLKHKETMTVLSGIKSAVENLAAAQAETSRHLFHDNGNKSMQSRMNEQGVVLAALCRAMWIVYGVLITALVGGMVAGAVAIAKHVYGAGG